MTKNGKVGIEAIMSSSTSITAVFEEFSVVASDLCVVIDSAQGLDRAEFLLRVYGILPRLIQSGIALPSVSCSDDDTDAVTTERVRMNNVEWEQLYGVLKEKLGDWDLYWKIFDPTTDSEAVAGSLADDLADIYRDIADGLRTHKTDVALQQDAIFSWRLLYYSHWGQHAMSALYAIHFLLNDRLS